MQPDLTSCQQAVGLFSWLCARVCTLPHTCVCVSALRLGPFQEELPNPSPSPVPTRLCQLGRQLSLGRERATESPLSLLPGSSPSSGSFRSTLQFTKFLHTSSSHRNLTIILQGWFSYPSFSEVDTEAQRG